MFGLASATGKFGLEGFDGGALGLGLGGGGGGGGGGDGGGNGGGNGGGDEGYGWMMGGNGGGGGSGGGGDGGDGGGEGGYVNAAILSHHNVHHFDVKNEGYIKPTTIDVPAHILPVSFVSFCKLLFLFLLTLTILQHYKLDLPLCLIDGPCDT